MSDASTLWRTLGRIADETIGVMKTPPPLTTASQCVLRAHLKSVRGAAASAGKTTLMQHAPELANWANSFRLAVGACNCEWLTSLGVCARLVARKVVAARQAS